MQINHFLLLKKLKNNEIAQLCFGSPGLLGSMRPASHWPPWPEAAPPLHATSHIWHETLQWL